MCALPTKVCLLTHSSILVWRIPWTEEPGGLQYMGSQRVGHDWATWLHFTHGFSSSHVQLWESNNKEGWAAENWCSKLWCWRRLLRVPWTSRRSNPSILKEITLNIHREHWCWSGNSNALTTWCEELAHWKRRWSWERLKTKGEVGSRGWDG